MPQLCICQRVKADFFIFPDRREPRNCAEARLRGRGSGFRSDASRLRNRFSGLKPCVKTARAGGSPWTIRFPEACESCERTRMTRGPPRPGASLRGCLQLGFRKMRVERRHDVLDERRVGVEPHSLERLLSEFVAEVADLLAVERLVLPVGRRMAHLATPWLVLRLQTACPT